MWTLWGLYLNYREKEMSVYAAYGAFFLILSVFPALALLLGLLRYTSLDPADLMIALEPFLPDALQAQAWELILGAYHNTSRLGLSLSAVTALWSAGKGIHGLMRGMDRIYGIKNRRGWLRTRLLGAGYMVIFLLALLLTLVIQVFGNTILRFWQLHGSGGLMWWIPPANLRLILLLGLQTGIFCLLMMFLPGRNNGFRESIPGALLASLGWMAVSGAFSLYVERFSGYSSVFGSVYGMALGILWVYGCVTTVFLGAMVNRVLAERKG